MKTLIQILVVAFGITFLGTSLAFALMLSLVVTPSVYAMIREWRLT